MNDEMHAAWRPQSGVTDPGAFAAALDELPSDLADLRRVSQQLVTHYMGSSDGSTGPVTGERLHEVDTRYAAAMFARLLELGPRTLMAPRPPERRIVGCCRDFTVLFVAMARHKGFSARARMGYASYFRPSWHLDHVIAEVWDPSERRWRLIEPEISDTFAAEAGIDPLDLPQDSFLTGPRAWLLARSGRVDPERCVVSPELDIPYTCGWLSLRHHLVQDLAALNKAEMVLWDEWGVLAEPDPLRDADALDRLAEEIGRPDVSPSALMRWAAEPALKIPQVVRSYSPASSEPCEVNVVGALQGMLDA